MNYFFLRSIITPPLKWVNDGTKDNIKIEKWKIIRLASTSERYMEGEWIEPATTMGGHFVRQSLEELLQNQRSQSYKVMSLK